MPNSQNAASRPGFESGASSVGEPIAPARRLFYLDWLRVLAILGVFMVHAVHPFGGFAGHINNPDSSRVITLAFFWLWASWGIALFFLISGGASTIALARRTPKRYVVGRAFRLLIPYVVGTLLFSVVQIWFDHRSNGLYEGSLIDFVPRFLETRAYGAALLSPRVFSDWGLHLWFLGFLFVISVISLPLIRYFRSARGQRFVDWAASVAAVPLGLTLFAVPLVVLRWLLQPIFPEGDDWSDFVYLLGVFVLGALLFADKRFRVSILRDWLWMAFVGAAALGTFIVSAREGWHDDPGGFGFLLAWGAISIAGWCLSLFCLAFGMRFLDFTNRFLDYAMDIIVPFYVIHHPVVIGIAFYVIQWDANLYVKAVTVLVSSLAATVALIEVFVRRFTWTRVLFGMGPLPGTAHASSEPRSRTAA